MDRTADSVARLRRLALLGVAGGLLFCIGDQLFFLTPGFDMATFGRPDWPVMPMWRFALSTYLGVAGMPLLVAGTYSLYRAVADACPRWAAGLALFGITGVIGGGESLGEGCVCLFAWNHWRQVEREAKAA